VPGAGMWPQDQTLRAAHATMREFTLQTELWLPRPRAEIFPFFAEARNLEVLTPPWLQFEVLTPGPIELRPGQGLGMVAHPFVFPRVGVYERHQRAGVRDGDHFPKPSRCLGLLARSRVPRPSRAQALFKTGSARS
jgi:hypothetical protein